MRIKYIFLTTILFLASVNSFPFGSSEEFGNDKTDKIFTSKDKDHLQYWHYNEVLKMDLNEDEMSEYFTILNNDIYKMSRLGLEKYDYSDAERKEKFEELAAKLEVKMKDMLSLNNFKIHQECFDKIKHIVYERRNWEE